MCGPSSEGSFSSLSLECSGPNVSLTQALDPCHHPRGSNGKESVRSAGNPGSIPGSGRSPGEGNGSPLQYFHLENPTHRGILVGYSPWGRKECDRTERPTLLLSFMIQRKEVKSHLILLPFVWQKRRRASPAFPVGRCNNAALLWIQQ